MNQAVTITVDDTNLSVHYAGPPDADPLTVVHIDLKDAAREGHLALAQRIGVISVFMAARADPAAFSAYPQLADPHELTPLEGLIDVVNQLLKHSVRDRPRAYLGALDELFARHGTELAQTNLPAIWPTLREGIERY